MNSLKEVFTSMTHQDHVKVAQAQAHRGEPARNNIDPALLKQAQDYDSIGRILAHNVFNEKLAEEVAEAMPEATDEEKAKALAALIAKANGQEAPAEASDKEESEESEKKAHVKSMILERMAQDPSYVSRLVGKYYGR